MPEEHWNYIILWEKNLGFPLDVIHHAKSRQYTANVPLPSKLACPMDVLAIKESQLQASLIRNLMSFKALSGNCQGRCIGHIWWIQVRARSQHARLGKIMEELEDFCIGETHEAYESSKFHLQHHHQKQSKAYISSLHQLAKNCNFGVLEDRSRDGSRGRCSSRKVAGG